MIDEALSALDLQQVLLGAQRCLAHVPASVRADRVVAARQLIVHMCAERERALAEGGSTARSDWRDVAADLIDAIVGLLLAPVTQPVHHEERAAEPPAPSEPKNARELVTQGDPMKVTVDQDRCVASGQCVVAAADVFDQRDEDGVVVLLLAEPSAEQADDVRHAAAVCPALAIHLEE